MVLSIKVIVLLFYNFNLKSTYKHINIKLVILRLDDLHCGRLEVSALTTVGTPKLASAPLIMPHGNHTYYFGV